MNTASSGGSCGELVTLSASEEEDGVVVLDADVAEVSFSLSSAASWTISLALIISASRS